MLQDLTCCVAASTALRMSALGRWVPATCGAARQHAPVARPWLVPRHALTQRTTPQHATPHANTPHHTTRQHSTAARRLTHM